VADGSVYVGSEDGHLYALDAASGAERWDVAMPYGGESSATVSKGVVYYTNPASATLFALSASTGHEIWRFAGAVARPAVANGTVYVATAGGVVALDPGTGAKRWGQSADMSNWSPVVEGNEVFIATYSGGVVAFNATTGRHLWTASIPGGVYTTVAAANGVVYAGTQQSGRFVCLDASSGHQILSVESYSIFSSAVIADGVIYAGTGRRTLYGYGLP
jgi:outer membrane protein assembly factor BamB